MSTVSNFVTWGFCYCAGGPHSTGRGISAPPSGKQSWPTDDLVVQEAAEHAMKMLQQGSNSLASYELSEIVSADAEVCVLFIYLFI